MPVDRVALRARLRASGRHAEAAGAAAIAPPPLSGNEPTGMDAATGRLFTGIEVTQHYYDVSVRRLQAAVPPAVVATG